MSSQSAFILTPIALASVYTINKEMAFYGSSLIAVISSVCVVLMIRMPGSRQFGKMKKEELPIQKEVTLPEKAVENCNENAIEMKEKVEAN